MAQPERIDAGSILCTLRGVRLIGAISGLAFTLVNTKL